MIEYHPALRFGKKLELFPPELRRRLDKQREEYKRNKRQGNNNNNNNNRDGISKRKLKKVKREIRQLSELVEIQNGNGNDNSNDNTIANANANPMGGQKQRQQHREQQRNNNNNDDIRHRIAELRASLNISQVCKLRIKQAAISDTTHPRLEYPPRTAVFNECYTNAECGVAGINMIPISYTNRCADVNGYMDSLGTEKNVPIVSAATSYTCPQTDQVYILVFHEFLWFGCKLDHSLINPNQVRAFGIGFWDNPYDTDRGLFIDVNDSLHNFLSEVWGTRQSHQ